MYRLFQIARYFCNLLLVSLFEWANGNEVPTIYLPPHTTHALQPACFFTKFYLSNMDIEIKFCIIQRDKGIRLVDTFCIEEKLFKATFLTNQSRFQLFLEFNQKQSNLIIARTAKPEIIPTKLLINLNISIYYIESLQKRFLRYVCIF